MMRGRNHSKEKQNHKKQQTSAKQENKRLKMCLLDKKGKRIHPKEEILDQTSKTAH